MIVTLEEMKQYLRVDYEDDDQLSTDFITSAEQLCRDVLREMCIRDRCYSDRKQTTIWEYDRPKSSTDHPTMKPVALMRCV